MAPVRREAAAQAFPRAMEARLDGRNALAEDPGRLLGGELLHVPQDQDGAIGIGELIDGTAEDGARLAVEKLGFGRA